jgi:hypothetical protein
MENQAAEGSGESATPASAVDRFEALLSQDETAETGSAATPQNDPTDELAPNPDNAVTEGADAEVEAEKLSGPAEVEVEFEGEKYKVPEKLKNALMLHADYTRKTQEVAEQRKTLEQERKTVEAISQISEGEFKMSAAIMQVDSQLHAYQNVDWATLYQQDPNRFAWENKQFQDLKDTRSQLANQLQGLSGQRVQQTEAMKREALQKGAQELARAIPGWNADLANKLGDVGEKSYGFSKDELTNITDPRMVKVLHDAYQFQKLKEAKVTAVKQVQALPKLSKPGAAALPGDGDKQASLMKNLRQTGSRQTAVSLFERFVT